MFVVTNRDLDAGNSGLAQFGGRANRDGPNELRMVEVRRSGRGWAVDIIPDDLDHPEASGLPPKDWRAAAGIDEKWLRSMGIDPAATVHGSMYVAKKILERVNPKRAGMGRAAGRNLLVFVHGYNNDMKDVVERAAGFEQEFGVEVLAFSWPANGGGVAGTASYLSDKNDARVSVGALDRTLAKLDDLLRRFNDAWVQELLAQALARHPDNDEDRREMIAKLVDRGCPFDVNLILHSMGNYLFKHLMLSSTSLGARLMFDNVVLCAADTNNREHALWVDRIRVRRRVFVTLNENDSALRVSRLKLGEQQLARLGHWPHELDSAQASYVDFTAAPHVGGSHAYFEGDPLRNPKVRRFFQEALNGQDAERRLRYEVATNMYRIK